MKKLYKVILALAVSLGCAYSYAEGTSDPTTDAVETAAAVQVSSYGNTVTVTNAEGEVATVVSLLGGTVTTVTIVDGQITVDAPTGLYQVVVGGTSETVYIQQ